MKVKVIYSTAYHDGEEKVNEFIKGRKVRDIKFNTNYVEDEDHYSFMIMYEE